MEAACRFFVVLGFCWWSFLNTSTFSSVLGALSDEVQEEVPLYMFSACNIVLIDNIRKGETNLKLNGN